MDTDLATFAGARRDKVGGATLLKALLIKFVGVIDFQKPSEACASMFSDNQIITLGRSSIAFPLLSAGCQAASENGVIDFVKPAPKINLEQVAGLVDVNDPVERVIRQDR